jgi:hypothetical protein
VNDQPRPGNLWNREPAMVLALVQACVGLAVILGLRLPPGADAALLTISGLILGLVTRSKVSPVPPAG